MSVLSFKLEGSIIYTLLKLIFKVTLRLFLGYKVYGTENIPPQKGLILASNHASFLDIPSLICGTSRRIYFVGRSNLFPIPGLRKVIKWLGWIPIKENTFDRVGFGRAKQLVETRNVVAIFPEGTRTKTGRVGEGRPGLGYIVFKTGCSVVPVYISGTYEALPIGAKWIRFHPITIAYGNPINFQNYFSLHRKEFYKRVNKAVMTEISQLENLYSAQKNI